MIQYICDMLIDEATVVIKAGNGGNGSASFLRNGQTAKGGPDGGNGGNGGDVYFQGVNDISALTQFRFKKSFKAEDGIAGKKYNLYGRNGEDLIIKVPIGTFVTDEVSKHTFEIKDETTKIILAKGGKGGRGNREFRSATNQAPKYAEKGGTGEEKKLKLELKLIADVGVIGLPNAGKSSLLSVLTNATPKIGNYPFTTLEPNLGVMDGIVIADIPGLIEGASIGKGLGIKFLKHVEKTKFLMHCIDSTENDFLRIYEIVRKELETYNEELLKKPEIILLTKTDLTDEKILKDKIKVFNKIKKNIILVSIYNEKSLDQLREIIKGNL